MKTYLKLLLASQLAIVTHVACAKAEQLIELQLFAPIASSLKADGDKLPTIFKPYLQPFASSCTYFVVPKLFVVRQDTGESIAVSNYDAPKLINEAQNGFQRSMKRFPDPEQTLVPFNKLFAETTIPKELLAPGPVKAAALPLSLTFVEDFAAKRGAALLVSVQEGFDIPKREGRKFGVAKATDADSWQKRVSEALCKEVASDPKSKPFVLVGIKGLSVIDGKSASPLKADAATVPVPSYRPTTPVAAVEGAAPVIQVGSNNELQYKSAAIDAKAAANRAESEAQNAIAAKVSAEIAAAEVSSVPVANAKSKAAEAQKAAVDAQSYFNKVSTEATLAQDKAEIAMKSKDKELLMQINELKEKAARALREAESARTAATSAANIAKTTAENRSANAAPQTTAATVAVQKQLTAREDCVARGKDNFFSLDICVSRACEREAQHIDTPFCRVYRETNRSRSK